MVNTSGSSLLAKPGIRIVMPVAFHFKVRAILIHHGPGPREALLSLVTQPIQPFRLQVRQKKFLDSAEKINFTPSIKWLKEVY